MSLSFFLFEIFFFRYNREEVVRSLGKEINLNPPLTLGQLPDTGEELLKLDQVSNVYNQTEFHFCAHIFCIINGFLCSIVGFHQIRTKGWHHLCEGESIQ